MDSDVLPTSFLQFKDQVVREAVEKICREFSGQCCIHKPIGGGGAGGGRGEAVGGAEAQQVPEVSSTLPGAPSSSTPPCSSCRGQTTGGGYQCRYVLSAANQLIPLHLNWRCQSHVCVLGAGVRTSWIIMKSSCWSWNLEAWQLANKFICSILFYACKNINIKMIIEVGFFQLIQLVLLYIPVYRLIHCVNFLAAIDFFLLIFCFSFIFCFSLSPHPLHISFLVLSLIPCSLFSPVCVRPVLCASPAASLMIPVTTWWEPGLRCPSRSTARLPLTTASMTLQNIKY